MHYFQFVARGRLGGLVEIRNVFYLECPANPTNAELLQDAPAYLTGFYTPIRAALSSLLTIYGFDVQQWDPVAKLWKFRITGNMTLNGTNDNDPLPSQNAAVLVARTAAKRTFSRKFLAGFCDNSAVGNLLHSNVLVALTGTLFFWLSDFTAPSGKIYTAGLWTKRKTFEPFLQGVTNAIVGSMRRRKQNVGL